jgi:hypothetical protein
VYKYQLVYACGVGCVLYIGRKAMPASENNNPAQRPVRHIVAGGDTNSVERQIKALPARSKEVSQPHKGDATEGEDYLLDDDEGTRPGTTAVMRGKPSFSTVPPRASAPLNPTVDLNQGAPPPPTRKRQTSGLPCGPIIAIFFAVTTLLLAGRLVMFHDYLGLIVVFGGATVCIILLAMGGVLFGGFGRGPQR